MSVLTRKLEPIVTWLWHAIAWPAGWFLAVWTKLSLMTMRVSVRGMETNHIGAAVYVNWHKYVPFLCIHHGQHKRWLMVSGAPYMDTIARCCRLLGLKVVRGAAGPGGRQALGELLEPLKRGESVFLAVDGPGGPAFHVKRGCVDLARASGVPIIPVAYRCKKAECNKKRWDQWLPVEMFDTIEVRYGQPIFVCASQPDSESIQRVHQGLKEVSGDG
jgi:lysophospholipid acyltransferase (LPLAT)-like uncharacterized protein